MLRTVLLLLLALAQSPALSQNPSYSPLYDNVWLMGYESFGISPDWGGTRILFSTNPPKTIREDRHMDFDVNDASMSDSSGHLLFYTNGYYIANAKNDTMLGGTRINPDTTAFQDKIQQGVLALAFPGHPNQYCLIHEASTWAPSMYSFIKIYRCLYSTIDMTGDNGQGEVIESNHLLHKDIFCYGKLTACKHANGRDWWILIPKWNSATYFSFLLTPDGFDYRGIQQLGEPCISGIGQAVFSPDGSTYAKLNSPGSPGAWLDIYDFDRCTGTLSNYRKIFKKPGAACGVAISPNSRYLYLSLGFVLYQYDLYADDLEGSETIVGEYDGFQSPLPTYFFMLQPAPDGKIYMNSASNVNRLHVISAPDFPGAACHFEQHAFAIPTLNNWSLPNFPNYRLGPLDGSACDTLGLNNQPVAHFRWAFWDTLSPLHVFFNDLSVYDPQQWQWDFGDGATSTDKHPEHTYTAPGTYPVCLTVRNDHGADTICYTLTLEASSTETAVPVSFPVLVLPNPFRTALSFEVPVEPWQRVDAVLFDGMGRLLARTAWRGPHGDWPLAELPVGVFFYRLTTEDGRQARGKVVKW